jgi:dihydroxyacid dehydratase/phosphogluconate dehydratase
MATLTGKHIVQMVWDDVKPSDILTSGSFHNAVTTVLALGGSTNAVVHLITMARRAGVDLTLDRFDALARRTPLLANIRPSGKYLMEDFYYAGGLRTMLARLGDLLHRDARTVNGRTLGENVEGFKIFNDDVIRPLDKNEQEARQAVAATRDPPEGVRGFASVSGRRASAG